MDIIFKKSNLPYLERVIENPGSGRDQWRLTRMMQDRDALNHQLSSELLLLQRGAHAGDVWSMCELARTYFHHCGDLFLPHAMMWWRKAALQKDQGALWDIGNLPIRQRILNYQSGENEYANIEMQCTMLAEWHLTGLGIWDYDMLSQTALARRSAALVADVTPLLELPEIDFAVVPGLNHQGNVVDGLAYSDGRVQIRSEMMRDRKRLVQVIFHELGHQVEYQILLERPNAQRLQSLFRLSPERIASWSTGAMGYEVSTMEEDPDTLSYGVYTNWLLFFG